MAIFFCFLCRNLEFGNGSKFLEGRVGCEGELMVGFGYGFFPYPVAFLDVERDFILVICMSMGT